MKKHTLILLLCFPLFLKAQNSSTILPDSVWQDTKSIDWYPNGSTFFNYNGSLYAIIMKYNLKPLSYPPWDGVSIYPYFFLVNKDGKNERMSPWEFGTPPQNHFTGFGYPDENGSQGYYPDILGRNFCFTFNGMLWYYQHIRSAGQNNQGVQLNESYECFAQLNLNKEGSFNQHYYAKRDPIPDVWKEGGFQLDSLMFFIGYNHNESSPQYKHWCFQQCIYDSHHNNFPKGPDIYVSGIPPSTGFGGCFKRLDSLYQEHIVLATFEPGTANFAIGLLTPQLSGDQVSFKYKQLTNYIPVNPHIAALAIMPGAIKGQRTSTTQPDKSDRITLLYISSNKSSDGKYHVYYQELYLSPSDHLELTGQGEVKLGNYPWPVYNPSLSNPYVFNLNVAYELIPKDYSNLIAGVDGFQQRMDFFYPDKKGHLNAMEFYSDQFKLLDVATVVSADLDDTVSYKGIKGLWSLNGIVDGAPPCSMNWHAWDSTLALNQHPGSPTGLEIRNGSESSVSMSGSFEDRWSVGENLDFSKQLKGKSKLALTFGEEMKYYGAYEQEIQSKTTWKEVMGTSFELSEENQETGCFLWTVPEMTRYKYDVYPWWDNGYNYPVPNTTQYLFRTTNMATILEPVKLEDDPFYITDPNSPAMASWKSGGSRDSLLNQSMKYQHPPIGNLYWTNGESGTFISYEITQGTSTKYTYQNGYEVKVSAGVKKPEVFKFSVSASEDIQFTTTVENETEFGTEISASLQNLSDSALGVNIAHLNMDVYWLYYDSIHQPNGSYVYTDWWYWARFNGMKPWYIAYLVHTVYSSIRLESPGDQSWINPDEIAFSWITEGEPLDDYKLYIANSPNFNPSSIVWREPAGKRNSVATVGFHPEPGKAYYWLVSGRNEAGEFAWSDRRSFTVETQPEERGSEASLKAVIYPNPSTGQDIHVTFTTEASGQVTISLYEMNGRCLSTQKADGLEHEPVTVRLCLSDLPSGIYLAEIRSHEESVMKKLVRW